MKTKFTSILFTMITISIALLTSCQPSPGKVTFWVQNDLGAGTINVTVTGYETKTISSYYPGGSPGCSASGCATYNLNPGNYNYTAISSDSSLTWNGSVTVTENGCLTQKLIN